MYFVRYILINFTLDGGCVSYAITTSLKCAIIFHYIDVFLREICDTYNACVQPFIISVQGEASGRSISFVDIKKISFSIRSIY